jgi:hypothetical protein
LIKTTHQHLLLLVGFDTLIYQKYYYTPLYLWVITKPIKKLDGSSTIKFFNEIITRYGVPHSIITDNGTNFAKGVFAEYYGKKGIRLDLASVAHR